VVVGSIEVDLAEWDQLRVERQAWLVCRDEAARQTRRWFDVVTRIGRAGMGFRTAGHGTDLVNEARSERLSAMQFAVKDLIPRLSADEITDLRSRRVLPDWFVPEMLRLARPIELELRRR
jgi:hypothetical protein